MYWQTATAAFFLDPASWLSLTALSITARGERELGECAADIPDTLIPTKTSSRETVTTIKSRTLLFDMGIMGILISEQSTLNDYAMQTNLIRA